MLEERTVNSVQEYRRRKRVSWKVKEKSLVDVENDLKEMDVRGWGQIGIETTGN